MLKLKRKTEQSLIIDDVIKVKVLETRGEFVQIGIDAPDDVLILREELYSQDNEDGVAQESS